MSINDNLINIWNNIYGNKGDESIKIIKDSIKDLRNCEDNVLQHPFCHESAHQCLTKIKDKNAQYLKQHKIRIEIFKIIWESAIKRNILNDINYKDKYGCTAIQRLVSDFPRKLIDESDKFSFYTIDYDVIDQDLASWIKENIEKKYKLHLNPIKKKFNRSLPIENDELYPIDYYGLVTKDGKIIRENNGLKPIKNAWIEDSQLLV